MPRRTLGALAIFGLATSWGIISILVREIPLPAIAQAGWRMALAAAPVTAVLLVTGRRHLIRIPNREVAFVGVLLATHWATYFGAILETSVASANLITYANPILMAVIAPILIDERLGPRTAGALAVSVAGIALITVLGPTSGSGAVEPFGVGLAVLSAISYAFLIVMVKKSGRGIEPVQQVFTQTVVGAAILSPFAIFGGGYGEMDAVDWLRLALLGILLTGVSGVVYVSALRFVPATEAGILAYMEPVSAALLAVLILGEQMTWAIVVGGVLIVAAGVAVITQPTEPVPAGIEEPIPAETASARR